MELQNFYDSHVHWAGTGESLSQLDLNSMKSLADLELLKLQPHHFRGPWLVGYGWDHSKWNTNQSDFPCRQDLDRIFKTIPVVFYRVDRHALWINSVALDLLIQNQPTNDLPDVPGGAVLRDATGKPTGILIDNAMNYIKQLLPPFGISETKAFLIAGQSYFQKAGFSFIRDLGGNEIGWAAARELAAENKLDLHVQMNMAFYSLSEFEKTLTLAIRCQTESVPQLQMAGVKFFYDGALGSNGAYLSQKYPGTESHGLVLYSKNEVQQIFTKTWNAGIPVAVHALGDQAIHELAEIANELKSRGIIGPLHFEHCEVVRPDTIPLLKNINAICHMQPCHFLSDRAWLRAKLGPLYAFAFPWAALTRAGIKVFFGSDAPIEPSSRELNQLALEEAYREGIEKPLIDFNTLHCYR